MDKFYFPARSDKVSSLLRNGIRLPQGDDPVIYVLGSREAAAHFGSKIYGDRLEVLEINGDFKAYGTGEAAPVGFIALSEAVPASALSRPTRLRNITETDRQCFGGRYDGSKNRATAERSYVDYFGRAFHLRRDLDAVGKPYHLVGPMVPDIAGEPGCLEVDGARIFGSGLPWAEAELIADSAIGANIDLLRDLPRVKLFARDGEMPEIIQEGLAGVSVEIWEVSPEQVERRTWEGWLDEPGWYWQRMDVAQLHGPFENSELAFRDTAESYCDQGILPQSDRPAAAMGR